MTKMKRKHIRDTMLSVIAEARRKKKKEDTDKDTDDDNNLIHLADVFGLMHIARPLDKPLETVYVQQNLSSTSKKNEFGETLKYECWDTGATRGAPCRNRQDNAGTRRLELADGDRANSLVVQGQVDSSGGKIRLEADRVLQQRPASLA